jgi:hypothetical protein
MSGSSTNVKCSHRDGQGHECGGELMFSHQVVDKDITFVYICKKCGKRTGIIQGEA